MRFSTAFTVLACGAMSLAAAVSPEALLSRSTVEVSSVLTTLGNKVDSILLEFDTCKDASCTKTICGEIVSAVDSATSSVSSLKGDATQALAQQIANIDIKIVSKLDTHKTVCNGDCGDLAAYATVDTSVASISKQLEVSVPGILALVKNSVSSITETLKGLGLTATIKALGL